jgi:hypothetical protein
MSNTRLKKIAGLVPQLYHRMFRTVANKEDQEGRKWNKEKERVTRIWFAKPL